MKLRKHSPEFKLQTCRRALAGTESQAQICRDLDLAHSVLERWLSEYRRSGESSFGPRKKSTDQELQDRLRHLEGLCGRLAAENDILKRALRRYQLLSATA